MILLFFVGRILSPIDRYERAPTHTHTHTAISLLFLYFIQHQLRQVRAGLESIYVIDIALDMARRACVCVSLIRSTRVTEHSTLINRRNLNAARLTNCDRRRATVFIL